jgi:SAM-dependent methyltransferase
MVWDFIGIPLRLLFLPDKLVKRLGMTTKQEERLKVVLPHVRGDLLDIAAGTNDLVKNYGSGIGIDVTDWGGGAKVVESFKNLPFSAKSFDTVCLIACLNHIPDRDELLAEILRILRPGGQLLITMIGPILGGIGHRFWWYGDKKHRLIEEHEKNGMRSREIWTFCETAGFTRRRKKRFLYGLNNLYFVLKPELKSHPDNIV